MILLLQIFWTFFKIGLFTFGGGLSMIALIQGEVVVAHGWLSLQEFTDILAISQMTPGPIGINTATYVGYTAMVNAGYAPWLAILGATVASFAAILLPVVLMLLVTRYLLKHRSNSHIDNLFRVLRIAVVGLVAAAALSLMTSETFGFLGLNLRFLFSCFVFVAVFVASLCFKVSPILLLLASGILGLVVYSV